MSPPSSIGSTRVAVRNDGRPENLESCVALSGTRKAPEIGGPDVAKNEAVTRDENGPTVLCVLWLRRGNGNQNTGLRPATGQRISNFRGKPVLRLPRLPTRLRMRRKWHLGRLLSGTVASGCPGAVLRLRDRAHEGDGRRIHDHLRPAPVPRGEKVWLIPASMS